MIAARIALMIGACAAAGCATTALQPGQPKVVTKLSIAPYEMHEDCVDLVRDDRLDYRFDSSDPLSFDIRYRDGGVILSPITRQNATTDARVFAPLLARRYCLTWEAGAQGATIGYRMLLRRNAR